MTNTNQNDRIGGETPQEANTLLDSKFAIEYVRKSSLNKKGKRKSLENLATQYEKSKDHLSSAECLLEKAKLTPRLFCFLEHIGEGVCMSSSNSKTCRQVAFGDAADNFYYAQEFKRASQCYEKANSIDTAANMAEEAGDFKRAARLYEKFAIGRIMESFWNHGIACRSSYIPELQKAMELYEKSSRNRDLNRVKKKYNALMESLSQSRRVYENEIAAEYFEKKGELKKSRHAYQNAAFNVRYGSPEYKKFNDKANSLFEQEGVK